MRKSLFSAAALAPLALLALQSGAAAQTQIADDLTSPVTTSTLNNGQPGNVVITSAGSVTVGSGVAVTVDSNGDFTNNGSITVDDTDTNDENDSNGGVGVLITTPRTGDFTNDGTISVLEDYTPEDTNEDGVLDGPFAMGLDRYGIRVTGPGPFTGDFNNEGAVTVEGNNSFGISLETSLIGDSINTGSINIVGNNSTAFRSTGTIDGDLSFRDQVVATGGGSKAVDIGGDITGRLTFYSSVQATGYRTTTRPATQELRDKLLPENMLQGGPAVTVAASVAGGILVGQPPAVTEDTEDDADEDEDGVPDVEAGTSIITSLGAAPGMLIGADGKDITIGEFGTGQNAYGLVVRGRVEGTGIFDGVDSNGIQVGTGGGTVNIEGGIRNVGAIRATAVAGDATALRILDGAQTPTLRNEGQLAATTSSEEDDDVSAARALVIEENGSLGSITNRGTIQARAVSDGGSAYAIIDRSGTLSNITNNNLIVAVIEPGADGDSSTTTGEAVAMDLRANTSGVTITQEAVELNPGDDDDDEEPEFTDPAILGDVLLGSGDDAVNLKNGRIVGDLAFGDGANSIVIDNGAGYLGELTSTGTVAIDVKDGVLVNRSATTVASNSLHVGAESTLSFAVDPESGTSSRINVSGSAVIDSGGTLGINILSLPQGSETFTIIQADDLSVGTAEGGLLTQTPYLFVATADVDEAAGLIDLTVRRRTAEEAGFNASEAAAYDSIYQALPRDEGILAAIVNQTDRDGLLGVYDQLLPDHAGGVTRALSWASEAAGRAAADWPRGETSPGPTRGWTQEIGLGETKERLQASAYRIYGFGAVGGVESMAANGSAIGFYTGFTTANVNNPDTPGDDEIGVSQLSLAAYYRGVFGGFHADVQVGGGYVWADSRRELIYTDESQVVHRLAQADWSGYSLFARAGLAYEYTTGRFVITPQAHIDYFRLHQGGYTEAGGGDGFDLAIKARTSDVLSITPSIVVGYTFGGRTKIRPELELGWRQVISGSAGETEGEFVSGGIPFTLFGEPIEGGGAIARLGFRVFNDYIDLRIDAGGEFRSEYTDLDLRLSARMVF